MKKYIFVFVCFITCFIVLTGCSSVEYRLAKENIAEIRECLYVGENKEINATLSCGKREKDYVINGYATELIEFGVLTFELLKPVDEFENFEPMFVLFVGTKRYDGVLEKNPFDGTYVADIKKNINTTDVVNAKIMCGTFSSEVNLNLLTDTWEINCEDALKIACKNQKENIKNFEENGAFLAEVYVKIVNDEEINKDEYFWYVNFVGRKGRNFAVIINTQNGEVMAEKSI